MYDDSFDTEPVKQRNNRNAREKNVSTSHNLKSSQQARKKKHQKKKMKLYQKVLIILAILITVFMYPVALSFFPVLLNPIPLIIFVLFLVCICKAIKAKNAYYEIYPLIVLSIGLYLLAMTIVTALTVSGNNDAVSGWIVFPSVIILYGWVAQVMPIAGIMGIVSNLKNKNKRYNKSNLIISIINLVLGGLVVATNIIGSYL